MFAPIFSVDLSIIVPHVEIAILKQFNLRAQLADTPCVLVQTEKRFGNLPNDSLIFCPKCNK